MDEKPISNEDERQQILRMIEEGKITASEGAALLSAVGGQRRGAPKAQSEFLNTSIPSTSTPSQLPSSSGSGKGVRMFRVLVTDLASGKNKVTVTLPLTLIDWGLRIGARYSPDVAEMQGLGEMLNSSVEGKLIDVIDEEDGEHVQIFVD